MFLGGSLDAMNEQQDVEMRHTGLASVDAVDAVVASVEALEQRPLEEHVAVFEAAHEQLRRALDAPAAEPA